MDDGVMIELTSGKGEFTVVGETCSGVSEGEVEEVMGGEMMDSGVTGPAESESVIIVGLVRR